MKKFLLPALFLFAATGLQAQTVSDFENVKLAEGTPYWTGIDMATVSITMPPSPISLAPACSPCPLLSPMVMAISQDSC